jgi:hypothetical protein
MLTPRYSESEVASIAFRSCVPDTFPISRLDTKLRKLDLALEEAFSDLRYCKNLSPERACSCYIGMAVLALDIAKIQIR